MNEEINYFDLRLNNCVNYNGNNVRIHEITAWGVKTTTTFLHSNDNYIEFKKIKPIKISPLNMSNFKFQGKGCFNYNDKFNIYLENRQWYIIFNETKFFFNYVHELQNFYSFIYKEELDIKLR